MDADDLIITLILTSAVILTALFITVAYLQSI
jgi:hypothetical protein